MGPPALARSMSSCWNITGVTTDERATWIRSSSAARSTWASNRPRAASILRSLPAVIGPSTAAAAVAVSNVSASTASIGSGLPPSPSPSISVGDAVVRPQAAGQHHAGDAG